MCNDERRGLGGTSGHGGFVHTSSGLVLPPLGRALAAALLVTGVAALAGRAIVESLVPLLDAMLVVVARDFTILRVGLVDEGRDTMVEARAMLRHAVALGPLTVRPDARTGLAVATTVGTVLQPLMTAVWLVLAWPGTARIVGLRLLATALLAPLMLCLDAPLYLLGSLWDLLASLHRQEPFLPVVAWMRVLGGGGRLALGLVAGTLAIGVAAAWARRRPPT